MNALFERLQNNGLIDDIGNIILDPSYKMRINGIEIESPMTVDVETFKGFFDSTDYSYEQLVEADQGKGYTRFFDQWKSFGIL